MKLMLATLCLNEIEWLEKLYQQHKNFPNLINWTFVEGADRVYAETNPNMVNDKGLSIDGTSEFLLELTRKDKRVTYIPFGFTDCSRDIAQGKCRARNSYLRIADTINPDYILVVDADEFWCKKSQSYLEKWLTEDTSKLAFSFNHREIWYPPVCKESNMSLFELEVIGGFWEILYCRAWKYIQGMRYIYNHNTPSDIDGLLTRETKNHRGVNFNVPEFIHLGFASQLINRQAKNRYYEARGELTDPRRKWYTESRALWETWQLGDKLPRRAEVVCYTGEIPEVFK